MLATLQETPAPAPLPAVAPETTATLQDVTYATSSSGVKVLRKPMQSSKGAGRANDGATKTIKTKKK